MLGGSARPIRGNVVVSASGRRPPSTCRHCAWRDRLVFIFSRAAMIPNMLHRRRHQVRLGSAHNLGPEFLQEDHGHLLIPKHLLQPGQEERPHHPHCGCSRVPQRGRHALSLASISGLRWPHAFGSLAKGSGRFSQRFAPGRRESLGQRLKVYTLPWPREIVDPGSSHGVEFLENPGFFSLPPCGRSTDRHGGMR